MENEFSGERRVIQMGGVSVEAVVKVYEVDNSGVTYRANVEHRIMGSNEPWRLIRGVPLNGLGGRKALKKVENALTPYYGLTRRSESIH